MTVTIDVLPDEVLLAIFDFHVVRYQDLDFIEAILSDYDMIRKRKYGRGNRSYMCADGGEALSLDHHVA